MLEIKRAKKNCFISLSHGMYMRSIPALGKALWLETGLPWGSSVPLFIILYPHVKAFRATSGDFTFYMPYVNIMNKLITKRVNCLIKLHAMWRSGGMAPSFFTLALNGGEW
jgi:hypothetical protein